VKKKDSTILLVVGAAAAAWFFLAGKAAKAQPVSPYQWIRVPAGSAKEIALGTRFRFSVPTPIALDAHLVLAQLMKDPDVADIQVWTGAAPPDWPADDTNGIATRVEATNASSVELDSFPAPAITWVRTIKR
jgi:hypothetical protein